jgi:FkbH-like protein
MLSFNELKKNLKKDYSAFKKIKIAILSDSASQLLTNAIKGYGFEVQLNFEIYEADYNQIDLQVFDPSSELYSFHPDFVVINRSTEKLLKDFYKTNQHLQGNFSEQILQTTRKYYETVTSRLKAKVIINTYPEINDSVFGNFAAKTKLSFVYQLRKANLLLMELSQEAKDMFVCDLASLQSELGYRFVFDSKMYVGADMVYSIEFLPYVAKYISDIILSISGTFKKCLILDLDNTTWGGIIGDDGMEGIQVGYFGLGKIFTDLQLWAKQLKNRGIILAICSKNTEEIAREPFDSHPDMVLRMDDIAVFVANWETKVDNIRYIQSILNIGFDSMVFVDDNPFEREMVKSGIPDITVPELPEDPAEYLLCLRSLNLFETASFTEEDAERTKQYQEEAQRNILLQSFDNEHDFLASLHMHSEVKAFDEFSIPRVAQLSQRSNQFNLRTIRYSEKDIKNISKDAGYYTMSLTLEDRFGNHGLIGIIILKNEDNKTLFIDSWIMSCRVLKRGMEQFTMNTIVDLARDNGFATIAGEYIATKKNGIVKDHYANLGFEQTDGRWLVDVAQYENKPTFIVNKNKSWSTTTS